MAEIPIITGAAGGGGARRRPSAGKVKAIDDAIEASLAVTREVAADAVAVVDAELATREAARDAAGDQSIGELDRRIDAMMKRSAKQADAADGVVIDAINDHIFAAHEAVRSAGGSLPVLLDDLLAIRELGAHDQVATELLVLPALRQQEQQLADQLAEPPSPVPLSPPPPPPFTVGMVFPRPPEGCPIGYVETTYPDVVTGQLVTYCRPADGPPPSPPLVPPPPPPDEPPPPPPVPPPPPPPAACDPCETPPQLVIRRPGCDDIVVGGGGSPPSPPTTSPPPAAPPPAAPPPPPPPKAPPPLTPPGTEPAGDTFDGPDGCARIRQMIASPELSAGVDVYDYLGGLLQLPAAAVSMIPIFGTQWAQGLSHIGKEAHRSIKFAIEFMASQRGIADPGFVTSTLLQTSVIHAIGQYTGIPTDYPLEPTMQAMRYSSPVFMPSQGGADAAYLRGQISHETWKCWTLTSGNLPWAAEQVMLSGRTLPGVQDTIALHRRQLIDDATYYEMQRRNGILDRTTADQVYQLAEQTPTATDIISWMSKDVDNPEYIDLVGANEGFAESWSPQLQKWADAIGLPRSTVERMYRAQWQLAPRTMVDEMVHRLRPGRVPKELEWTESDALLNYKLDEIPAKLRARYLAISYRPMNATQIGLAYTRGTMDYPEVIERLMDTGYDRPTATQIADMLVAKGEQEMQSSSGAWTRRKTVAEYVAGTVNREVADAVLSRTVLDPARREQLLDDADAMRAAQSLKVCLLGIKRRYYTGEIDPQQARAEMIARGMDILQADVILTGWECARTSRSKEPTVKQLREWVELGIITVAEFGRRLINLGYTRADADRIIQATDQQLRKRQAKEAEVAMNRAESKRRRAEADARRKRKRGG